MRNPRITCNLCTNRNCSVFNRDEEGRLRHFKLAMEIVALEKAGLLICFVPPRTKLWKFPDLVSKVRIVNPENPVIQLLS